MFKFKKNKRKVNKTAIGVRIDIQVNMISIEATLSDNVLPNTDKLAKAWLSENSTIYETTVTWLTTINNDNVFITDGRNNFYSDTPATIDLPNYAKANLILVANNGLLFWEYGNYPLLATPIEHLIKIKSGIPLFDANSSIEKIAGRKSEEIYPISSSDMELILKMNQILHLDSFSLENSAIKLSCSAIHTLSDLCK